MEGFKLNHIGIVVKDIRKSYEDYHNNYGFTKASDFIDVNNQGVQVVLLNCGTDVHLELIQPHDENSPAYNAAKKGGGLNHLCYEAADFDAALEQFKNIIVRSPRASPYNLFKGKKTFFIVRDYQLIEFVES